MEPSRGEEHRRENRQPQRAGQLPPAERTVAPGLLDQLARKRLVIVERGEDRVHALPLEAPKLRLSHRLQFATAALRKGSVLLRSLALRSARLGCRLAGCLR